MLRGAKAADMPIQQPVKFDLIINLKRQESWSEHFRECSDTGRRSYRIGSFSDRPDLAHRGRGAEVRPRLRAYSPR